MTDARFDVVRKLRGWGWLHNLAGSFVFWLVAMTYLLRPALFTI